MSREPPKTAASARPSPSGAATTPREAPLGDRARHAACRALARQARLFPELDLTALERTIASDPEPLAPLDEAFAYAIYDAAIRNWTTLSFLLARCTTQKLDDIEPRVRGVLLAASAQILLLDRVPVHGAINHAVEWAKRVIRPGAGGLANAVLRKIAALRPPDDAGRKRERYTALRDELPAPDGSALVLAEPVLPEDELERLAIATSHPIELFQQWLRDTPTREVRSLALHNVSAAPIILNTSHAHSPLPDNTTQPHEAPGHHLFTGSPRELPALLKSRRDIWVQDPASSLAVSSVANLKPDVILDLCAGQGTKTRQLAATFPNAKVVATDVDDARFNTLLETFRGSAQVSVLGRKRIAQEFLGQADLILLDVPCSNTGVLARRPEAKYRFGPDTLKSLLSVQKQIIADAITLLREAPRGKILYSTCSLEKEENQQQATWADRWHKLPLTRERSHRPRGQPGDPPATYTDGSYGVLLG